MEFFEAVERRRSVRVFDDRPVEDEKVQKILETVNQAPSAGNLQAYEVYAITKPTRRQALAQAARGQEYLVQAPLVLAFFAHPELSAQRYGTRGAQLYTVQDATIACTYAMLAATALDLSCVWVGAFNEKSVQDAIGSPPGWIPVALLPIGYAAESPDPRPRRKLEDIVHRG